MYHDETKWIRLFGFIYYEAVEKANGRLSHKQKCIHQREK